MTWPAVAVWLLILAGLWSRGSLLLYLFGVLGCLGTLQMLPGESLGGINILPQFACAALLTCKVAVQRGNVVRLLAAACDPARAGLFTAFFLYSLLTAATLPVIFARQVDVIPIAGSILSGTSPLAPGSANVTQPIYLLLTLTTMVAFSVLGSRHAFRRACLMSILGGGIALIATGLADAASASLGLSSLLDAFRTATYTLLTDNEVLGAKRVVGLQSEASVFGSFCVVTLGALTFLRPCFDPFRRRFVVPPTMAGLAIFAALSTSSSAYIGLVAFMLTYGVNWILRARSTEALAREDLHIELVVLVLGAFALFAVVVLVPAVLAPVNDMIDHMIFQKAASDSYIVRSMWTQVAWEAFLSTHLLGVGYGAARASNWVVSVLANAGLFGALLWLVFILRVALAPTVSRAPADIEFTRALRFSFIPWFVMFWFAGTIPDVGVSAASTIGLILAMTSREGRGAGSTALKRGPAGAVRAHAASLPS